MIFVENLPFMYVVQEHSKNPPVIRTNVEKGCKS
jgi:hypothetical protein